VEKLHLNLRAFQSLVSLSTLFLVSILFATLAHARLQAGDILVMDFSAGTRISGAFSE
jgi:hypothetical protein